MNAAVADRAGSVAKLTVGDVAPDFTLPTLRGGTARLSDLLAEGPVNLVFYRGGWCPLCQAQITRITLRHPEFEALNSKIIAISNESVEKGKTLLEKAGPPFPLVWDKGSKVIESYDTMIERRDVIGWVKRQHDYAMPAWFVVKPDGVISWAYRGRNFRDRPDIDKVLAHLRGE